MCVCGEDVCWILCGGKYKFLLRSAWIVLVITTLIDICAIMAYWQLAPKSLDSEPGLKLALILLVAVLFLYFFSALLSGFIIMKVSPRKREFLSEMTTLDSSRTGSGLTGFELHPMPYSDGFRRVLPNNAPPSFPYRNSPRTDTTEQQNSHFNTRENTRSNVGYRNTNVNDRFGNRYNTQSSDELTEVLVVPKIVITGPETSAPIYEKIKALTSESSIKSRNNLGSTRNSNVAIQNKTSNFPLNIESQTCELSTKSQSNLCSCSNAAFQKKLPPSNFYRTGVIRPSSAVGRPYLKPCINQSNTYSCYTNLTNKRLFSRSESYVNRPNTNADEKTSEMSTRRVDSHPAIRSDVSSGSETTDSENSEQYKYLSSAITCNTNSSSAKSQPVVNQYWRRVDSHPAIRSDVNSLSETTDLENSEQYKNLSSSITCNTNSSSAKSQPVVNQYRRRVDSHPAIISDVNSGSQTTDSSANSQLVVNQHRRYVVDKVPTASNPQTQMLFKAVLKSENLFKQAKYAPERNVNTTIPILV